VNVLITGGCGKCGTALTHLKHDKVFVDRQKQVPELSGQKFIQFDLRDYEELTKCLKGIDAVIHLAARSVLEEDSNVVMRENIEVTHNVLRAAHEQKIERVIFASSNHVVGMVELDNAPVLFKSNHNIKVDKYAPVQPDSPYGVSKAFGEDLGRYYAENGGPKFYAIRIGAVLSNTDDHPYAYAEMWAQRENLDRENLQYEKHEKRLKALWLSRRDFVQMIELCLEYKGSVFDIFYGVSDNARSWLDIEYARERLGYQPQDNAETWSHPPLTAHPH